MALESATYISDLNAANPAATDGLAQADDHFRLIKGAVKATFPNVTGAISATHTALDAAATFAGAITASVAEINVLDNMSATTAQLNSTALIGTLPVVGSLSRGSIVAGNASSVATAVTLGTSGHVLTSDGSDATWAAIPAVTTFLSGMVQMFANATVPTGWLECNGASVSRSTYADLFAAIGTTYGSTNGSSFNLPDMRGRFARGWDHGAGVDADAASRTGGDNVGSTQADAIRNITGTHSGTFGFHSHDTTFAGAFYTRGTGSGTMNGEYGYSGPLLGFDASRQVATGSDNRPNNMAFLFCIKV